MNRNNESVTETTCEVKYLLPGLDRKMFVDSCWVKSFVLI